VLHVLMRSPYTLDINNIFKMLEIEDDFVAIQDGVLIAIKNRFVIKKRNLYVLKDDLKSRSIININSNFRILSYVNFVKLTIKHKSQINW